jgi:hypothetical protein
MNDEREHRDPALDALIGEHSTETPPAHVDATILAAAHRAVGSGPRAATRAWRWWMPLAAAAVIGVVVIGVLPLAPSVVSEPPPTVTDVPTGPRADSFKPSDQPRADSFKPPDPSSQDAVAPPSSAPPPASTVARPTAKVAAPEPKFDAYRPAPDQVRSDRAHVDAAGAPPSQAAAVGAIGDAPASEPAPAAGNAAAARPSPPRSATAERALSGNARDEADARPRTVDEWIARIRTLRGRGDAGEATRALADFRAAFSDADARLPADLREWANALR